MLRDNHAQMNTLLNLRNSLDHTQPQPYLAFNSAFAKFKTETKMTAVDFYTNRYTHCKIQVFLRQAEQEDQEHH